MEGGLFYAPVGTVCSSALLMQRCAMFEKRSYTVVTVYFQHIAEGLTQVDISDQCDEKFNDFNDE